MKVDSLDNIPKEVLNELVKKYGQDEQYRINDDRENIAFGKKREYFLFEKRSRTLSDSLEFCFIWIGNNLWQFRYVNISCTSQALWRDPLIVLNELLE